MLTTTKNRPLTARQRTRLVERVDQAAIAELIERRFDGPFISPQAIYKELRRRKKQV